MPLRSVESGVLSITSVIKRMGEPLAGLTQKQLELVIASNKLNVAQASALLQGAKVSRQDRIQILKKLGLISATAGQTVATKGLALSMKQLTAIIWEQVKAWAMTPFGMATIAAASIFAIVKGIDALTVSLEESREKLADLKEEYNENESELTALNDELQTTIDRINELQGKDSLTFTEAEELENLQKQNAELERQASLLETIQKKKTKELHKSFVETMDKGADKDGYASFFDRRNELIKAIESNSGFSDLLTSELSSIESFLVSKSEELLNDTDGITYIVNPTTELEKRVNEWLDIINDYNDKLNIALDSPRAKENAFNRLIYNGFSDATEELKNLGVQGLVTAEHLQDPAYNKFIEKCIELGIITEENADSLSFLASGFNALGGAAEESKDNIEETGSKLNGIADSATRLQDAYALLDDAISEMEDGGLTIDTIKEIAKQVDNLTDYLYEENGVIKLNTQAWKEHAAAMIESDIAAIKSNIASIENRNATLENERKTIEDRLVELQNRKNERGDGLFGQLDLVGMLAGFEIDAKTEELNKITEDINKNTAAIEENQSNLSLYESIYNSYIKQAEDAAKAAEKLAEAQTDYVKQLSATQKLQSGFQLLADIYADIADGDTFDFSSILNNDKLDEAFGSLGKSYGNFIETIARETGDIEAAQAAFNQLATEYLRMNAAALEGADDVTVTLLEQMGITNAAAIVEAQLAYEKEKTRLATELGADTTDDNVIALYREAEAGSVTRQVLAELAIVKMQENESKLNTADEIAELEGLASSANATAESITRITQARLLMTDAERYKAKADAAQAEGDGESYQKFLVQAQEAWFKAQELIRKPFEYDEVDFSNLVVNFDGVSKSASEAKNEIESLYDAAKNGIEKLIDYRESMLEKDIENQKDAIEEQIDALEDFYDEQREMLEGQYDQEEYLQEQHEKRKAVTDLQGELAMLANDDSAWAQKRKLELQEELSDAEQDLSEFENEHALDEALDMLDDQEERQRELIQSQIDALDEKLNDPYALYNRALTDIKNNTADLYQEMIEYNRKYGSGNDDDVRDMWNDAYESNEDYRDKTGSTYRGIELGDYAGYDASGVGSVSSFSSTLRQGSNGNDVRALQYALNQLGYGNSGTRSLDGSFGSGTRSAVIAFQRNNGLAANGVVDSEVRAKLKALGYAAGTDNATPGWHEVNELGAEYLFVSPSDGTRYRMFTGGEKVLNADATDFLYQFANSGGGVLTKMLADLFKVGSLGNIVKPVQAIELSTGNIVIQGSCDNKTVSEIRRAQRAELEFFLKELNKLNK